MIFMTHPEHGATNVLPSEVEAHKANGWKESTHAEWMARKYPPAAEPVKRGRPRKAQ